MAGGKLEVQIGADKSEFDKKIKEIEFDIKELSKVKLDRLKLGLDTTEINNQIKDAKNSLNSFKTTVKDTGNAISGQFTKQVGNGGNTLMQFSRIAQDAPFGIMGIGNNITATAESFSYLKQQTGSTGGALKALASSIAGTGGILLGVSLLTTGLTLLSQSGLSVSDVIDKLTGNFDEFSREMQKANEEAAKTSGQEIASLKALISVAQDDNISRNNRLIAVQDLQKTYPAYFANLSTEQILNGDLTTVTKNLTLAIIERAKASAYASKIGELSNRELILTNRLNNEISNVAKNYKLSAAEAQEFRKQILGGADVFKSLDKFKKRAGFFDFTSAIATSSAVSDIREELVKIAGWQDLYTKAIEKSTKAYIPLNAEAVKATKEAKKRVASDPIASVTAAPLMDANQVAVFTGQVDEYGNKLKALPGVIRQSMIIATQQIDEGATRMAFALMEFNESANDLIINSIGSTFANLGTVIGEALAQGGNVLSAIGTTILQSLANFLSSMGDLLIKYGTLAIIKGKLDLAILKGGPVSIAAGIAAVAVGIALKAAGGAIGSFANSGGKSSSSGSGANNQSFTSSGFGGGGQGGGTVVFEIAGTKLIGVLSNTINANRRLGGQLGLG